MRLLSVIAYILRPSTDNAKLSIIHCRCEPLVDCTRRVTAIIDRFLSFLMTHHGNNIATQYQRVLVFIRRMLSATVINMARKKVMGLYSLVLVSVVLIGYIALSGIKPNHPTLQVDAKQTTTPIAFPKLENVHFDLNHRSGPVNNIEKQTHIASTKLQKVDFDSDHPPGPVSTIQKPTRNVVSSPSARHTNTTLEGLVAATDRPSVLINQAMLLNISPESDVTEADLHIPHIIHQTWEDEQIPAIFKPNIQSWIDKHPNWEYWFWSDKDISLLIDRCYPKEYLRMYKRYLFNIYRADSMRYFVLYLFGGVYADLDIVALKSHEKLLDTYPCVLTQETHEHSVLLYNNCEHPNLLNAYLACRPRHPFMQSMVTSLLVSSHKQSFVDVAGPFYETSVYNLYNSTRQQNGWTDPAHDVHVLEPKWVTPTFDPMIANTIGRKCINPHNRHPMHMKVCQELPGRLANNVPGPDALANHLWTHTYGNYTKFRAMTQFNVHDFVRKYVNVTQRILQMCPRI